jgi:hypothetical protein
MMSVPEAKADLAAFPRDQPFIDIDNIPPGRDFVRVVEDTSKRYVSSRRVDTQHGVGNDRPRKLIGQRRVHLLS